MSNPFKYRPAPGSMDWEDNPASNAMAWVSDSIAPQWCDGDHWTIRATGWLWAECSCCLTIRAMAVGAVMGSAVTMAVVALI